MSKKRILLIHNDNLLLKLYREKLEESGFAVSTIRELDQAPRILANQVPDVILLDIAFHWGSPFDFIKSVRADPATMSIPILILPTALSKLAQGATEAGATEVIRTSSSPIAAIISAVKTSLGLPPLGDVSDVDLFKPDSSWLEEIIAGTPNTVNQMRHCLPGVSALKPELPALHDLWALGHNLAEKATLLPCKPLAQLTSALDLLLQDLDETPEQINPSTIRTVGQALDFLVTITKPASLGRLRDPASSSILVVDDEEGAREFISAALQLAGLKADCAASPSQGLGKINGHGPDLIFLDVGLPEMNGFDLCMKIRTIENHKSTPVVFITGMATFQNKARASLSGGNDFIAKPFNLPELGLKALIWLYRGQLAMV
jgi:DNA-binding response OmpR family regulator